MIPLCIAATVGFMLAIRPALAHDANLPVSHTGRRR